MVVQSLLFFPVSVIRPLVFNLSYGYSPLVACVDLLWFPFMVVLFGLLLTKSCAIILLSAPRVFFLTVRSCKNPAARPC